MSQDSLCWSERQQPLKDELKNQVWEFIEGARVIDTRELKAKKEVSNSIVSVA
jgi:hypothetical protein